MKKYLIIILSAILLIFNVKSVAQEMTQFKKEIQGNTVQLVVNRKGNTTIFETQLLNSKKTPLILNRFESNSDLLADKNKYQFFNVIDFNIKGHFLYIFYNDFGKIFMDRYVLGENAPSTQKRILIGNHQILSYENGGDMESCFQAKWIDHQLYFHIDAKQTYGGRLNELFVFSEPQMKIDKVSFPKPSKIVPGNGFFNTLDIDANAEKVQKEMFRLLVENKITAPKGSFLFLGYLEHPFLHRVYKKHKVRDVEDLYLFYKTETAEVKIIRYDNNENLWILE
ncbi:hypothetical protein [Pedobacter caeni]|uniref:Uncharacterized protein n=1 Tax=Pedobacter caeni TaxID=288992 RepID=A0A1M4YVG9_9SPHI|nr:hypothetical protein [Pedobacter caeni]SHF09547.1 hypothetical protein SAMN04488522_10274 [Pedobacter caeni]